MEPARPPRNALAVFGVFLKLGLISFGGPIAHLGYFREEFVRRRGWMTEAAYADLVSLCQLLPGPTSSQIGFAIGLRQAGAWGGLAAFGGFTAPSALLMFAAAAGLFLFQGATGSAVLHGLMLVSVSVVAHAVIGMAWKLCRSPATAAIAGAVLAVLLIRSLPLLQPLMIICGAGLGYVLLRGVGEPLAAAPAEHGRPAWSLLAAFTGLLVLLPLLAFSFGGVFAIADVFYRAGALVFGGGHVVLPLLEAGTVERGWVDEPTFLAGYGAAQALPGPLFAFGGYLGAVGNTGVSPLVAGPVALVMLFAPGLLLVAFSLNLWERLRGMPAMAELVAAANAAVVGVLAAALWNPVITSAVLGPADALIAVSGLGAIWALRRIPVLAIVLIAAAGTAARLAGF